jgi:hypothetical protein
MENGIDIRIELHFVQATAFPAQLLLGVIEATERAIARVEREEIDEFQKLLPDIPAHIFDAMRYRAEHLTGRALNFQGASSGSIILFGIAAGLSYWLLDKTLGETVSETWRESDMHVRLKQILHARIGTKVKRIAGDIRPSRWSRGEVMTDVVTEVKDGDPTIKVVVAPGPELLPIPKQSEVLERREAHAQQGVQPDSPTSGGPAG